MRLLLIEDETDLSHLLTEHLRRRGFVIDAVNTIGDALAAVDASPYGLVLLDWRLPDGEGLEVLRHIRGRRLSMPVIMITAKDAVEDRVRGLDAGADDYLVKPFAVEELVARINAVLRRPGAPLGLVLRCAALEFDTSSRAVSVSGQTVTVPRRELQVLETLMRRAGRVVTRDALEAAMYSGDDEIESNATEVTLSRLRRRLSDAGAGVVIHTVRGVGWLLKEASA